MSIPDEAVEVLARVLANEALFNADMDGYGWNAETDSSDHFMPRARIRARGYLEAAAPTLIAEVTDDALRTSWDKGYAAGWDGHQERLAQAWDEGGEAALEREHTYGREEKGKLANPYRPTLAA